MKNRKQLHRLQQHENTQPPGKNKFSFLSHSLFLFRQIVARRRLELLAFFYFDSFISFLFSSPIASSTFFLFSQLHTQQAATIKISCRLAHPFNVFRISSFSLETISFDS
jgi:hypothetical protein